MKDRIKILASVFMMAILAVGASAQNYDYEYNDDVVIVNGYDNDNNRSYDDRRRGDRRYDNGRRNNKRANKQRRSERRWKASILDRAYAIAAADGRITRREKREIRRLENDLGIYRLDKNRRRICR